MSIAKIETTLKAQKDQGVCGHCGKPLPKGSAYRYFAHFRGIKHVRCMQPTCTPKLSERESSKLATIYAAQESATAQLSGLSLNSTASELLEEVRNIVHAVADDVREVADEYRDSSTDENGNVFNTAMDERADVLEEAADELEGWEPATDEEEVTDEWLEALVAEAMEAIDNVETS